MSEQMRMTPRRVRLGVVGALSAAAAVMLFDRVSTAYSGLSPMGDHKWTKIEHRIKTNPRKSGYYSRVSADGLANEVPWNDFAGEENGAHTGPMIKRVQFRRKMKARGAIQNYRRVLFGYKQRDFENIAGPSPKHKAFLEKVHPFDEALDNDVFHRRWKGKTYIVNRADDTYSIKGSEEWSEDGKPITGIWSRGFNIPYDGPDGYEANKKQMKKEYMALKRKLWKMMGMGQRRGNGKVIAIEHLQHIPFTQMIYGEKYAGKAAWDKRPQQMATRERNLRAELLHRQLWTEAEQVKFRRYNDLSVTHEQAWRRPWQPSINAVASDSNAGEVLTGNTKFNTQMREMEEMIAALDERDAKRTEPEEDEDEEDDGSLASMKMYKPGKYEGRQTYENRGEKRVGIADGPMFADVEQTYPVPDELEPEVDED